MDKENKTNFGMIFQKRVNKLYWIDILNILKMILLVILTSFMSMNISLENIT